ncbi:uncharacterized protein CLUP02_07140 [Colletotrichum lupini]|uniref:Uncharacterized protein n=1 Tax=Colletotrichum lupini TaxID=145971 RepID=A0A9Q8WFP5_9PEZI|nr:uncharacterized protein CLUP02_07140 [Colletotrichum lupini]UQC81654.1 hypothetical protein CLUP02_07140 [Colletotrichum lupini]
MDQVPYESGRKEDSRVEERTRNRHTSNEAVETPHRYAKKKEKKQKKKEAREGKARSQPRTSIKSTAGAPDVTTTTPLLSPVPSFCLTYHQRSQAGRICIVTFQFHVYNSPFYDMDIPSSLVHPIPPVSPHILRMRSIAGIQPHGHDLIVPLPETEAEAKTFTLLFTNVTARAAVSVVHSHSACSITNSSSQQIMRAFLLAPPKSSSPNPAKVSPPLSKKTTIRTWDSTSNDTHRGSRLALQYRIVLSTYIAAAVY